MTVGIPGIGIGGIFYLVSALLMPMRSLGAVLSGRSHEARWPLAVRQFSMAATILAALWLTGWSLGWLMATLAPAAVTGAGAVANTTQVHNVVKTSALLLSFGTLAVVLTMVQVLRLTLSARPTVRNDADRARSRGACPPARGHRRSGCRS